MENGWEPVMIIYHGWIIFFRWVYNEKLRPDGDEDLLDPSYWITPPFLKTEDKKSGIFIYQCKQKLNAEVNHEKTFRRLILVSKKHYIGILYDDKKEPIIKGMEGIKSDRPEFIQTAFREMIEDIKNDENSIPKKNLEIRRSR